jgi:hypothetical protein
METTDAAGTSNTSHQREPRTARSLCARRACQPAATHSPIAANITTCIPTYDLGKRSGHQNRITRLNAQKNPIPARLFLSHTCPAPGMMQEARAARTVVVLGPSTTESETSGREAAGDQFSQFSIDADITPRALGVAAVTSRLHSPPHRGQPGGAYAGQ